MLGTPKYSLITKLILLKWNIKDKVEEIFHLEPPVKVTLEIAIKDKNGNIIKRHKQRSHSFVSNYLAFIGTFMSMSYFGPFSSYWIRNTSGVWQTYNNPNYASVNGVMAVNDSNNDSTYGIVVGTGTTPPTANDYNMENIIANGTSSGQLQYGSHTFNPETISGGYNQTSTPTSGLVAVNGNTTSFQIMRTFTNSSGNSITVSEVGIIASFIVTESTSSGSNYVQNYALIVHDLLSSPVTIPNGSSLTVTYTFQTTT